MPKDFLIKTEVGSSTVVFIVDEIGGFVSSLIDLLLERRFKVYYFGIESLETFDYLSENTSFVYLQSCDNGLFKDLGYLYYFPNTDLEKIKIVFPLMQNFAGRLLIGVKKTFSEIEKLSELVESKTVNARVVIFEDVFGPRVTDGRLSKYFVSIGDNKNIFVEHPPKEIFFPVYSLTLLNEILRISFMPGSRGKIYFIKSQGISWHEFAFVLKNAFPQSDFVFKQSALLETDNDSEFLPERLKEIVIEENIESKLEETAEWFTRSNHRQKQSPKFSTEIIQEVVSEEIREQPSVEKENPVVVPAPLPLPGKKKRGLLFIFLPVFLLLSVMFSFLATAFFGINGIKLMQSAKTQLEKGEFKSALENCDEAISSLNYSKMMVSTLNPIFKVAGFGVQIESVSEAISFSSQMGESMKVVLLSLNKISVSASSFLKKESVDWTEVQRSVKTNFSSAYQQASLAQSSLKEAERGFALLKKSDFFESAKNSLQDYREKLLKGQKIALALPEILSDGGRKTYVLLIQNNLELRPTGGFISAFAIVNLENGKLVNFEVYDVYRADSQLKGQIEPPAKIKQLLGEQVWYLRDANFDPQFSFSADKILWFLDKEMHISADGVISLTLNTLKEILGVTGGVNLPDYNEKIDKNNLFQKVIQYSEVNFEGSAKKEEFLVSLTKAIYEKLSSIKLNEIFGIEGVIFSNLENKEAQVYVTDNTAQGIITELGWDGNMRSYKPRTEGYSVFSDYLYINEANLGINKTNYFTKRKIDQEITIDNQGSVGEKLTIDFENQSPSDNWPAGIYRNYLRIYLPKNTVLTSAFATDLSAVGIKRQFDSRTIEVFEDHEKTVIGLLLEVPVKSSVRLEVNYELQEKMDLTKKINSYLLLVQKQSGIYSDNYHLTVFLPPDTIPLRVIPKATVKENQLVISESLNKDKIFQIDIAR